MKERIQEHNGSINVNIREEVWKEELELCNSTKDHIKYIFLVQAILSLRVQLPQSYLISKIIN